MKRSVTRLRAVCITSLFSLAIVMAAVPTAAVSAPLTPGVASTNAAGQATGLQAKIIAVNPRLSHHKGRQLRVFVRNRGAVASTRGSIRLRSHTGKPPFFITEALPLPAIAPGGEVSMTFNLPRHLRSLPAISSLEAVAALQTGQAVLPPFSTNGIALPPPPAQLPGPAMNVPAPPK